MLRTFFVDFSWLPFVQSRVVFVAQLLAMLIDTFCVLHTLTKDRLKFTHIYLGFWKFLPEMNHRSAMPSHIVNRHPQYVINQFPR